MDVKTCYRCGLSYGPEGFYKNVTKTDGLSDHCRWCAREMARDRYYRDIDLARARNRAAASKQRDRNRERNRGTSLA